MNTRAARVVRGLTAAFFAVFVAALSHLAGGGSAPGGVGLVLALAFSSVVCVALAGTSLSIIRLCISVVFSQVVLHALFTVGAPTAGGPALQVMSMGHARHEAMVVVIPGAAGAVGAQAPGGNAMLDALASQLCSGMWIAHAVAAVVTIVALRRGEWAFWRLLQLAGLRLARLYRTLFVEPIGLVRLDRSAGAVASDHLRDRGVFLGRLRHRGPPMYVRFSF